MLLLRAGWADRSKEERDRNLVGLKGLALRPQQVRPRYSRVGWRCPPFTPLSPPCFVFCDRRSRMAAGPVTAHAALLREPQLVVTFAAAARLLWEIKVGTTCLTSASLYLAITRGRFHSPVLLRGNLACLSHTRQRRTTPQLNITGCITVTRPPFWSQIQALIVVKRGLPGWAGVWAAQS